MTQDSGLKTKDSVVRCSWAGTDPLYIKYHDEEWGKPVYDDKILFEFLLLEGAQASFKRMVTSSSLAFNSSSRE